MGEALPGNEVGEHFGRSHLMGEFGVLRVVAVHAERVATVDVDADQRPGQES